VFFIYLFIFLLNSEGFNIEIHTIIIMKTFMGLCPAAKISWNF